MNKDKDKDRYQRIIEEFRIIDDSFMTKVFDDDPEATEEVLKIILDDDSLKVMSVVTQKDIQNLFGHSLRLDVQAIDEVGTIYNIEIQRTNDGAVPERARYHSSLLDANCFQKGEHDYTKLPESYVIMITEKDVLEEDLPIYHIDRTIDETGKLFGDRSHIVYVNSEKQDDSKLGRLMHDFYCTDPNEMFNEVLAEKARLLKGSERGENSMNKALEEFKQDIQRETAKETRIGMVSKMIENGKLSCEEISAISGLSIEDVQELNRKAER